jgi:hypothetical protein
MKTAFPLQRKMYVYTEMPILATVNSCVADSDPESGAFLTHASGIRDPEWVKKTKIRIRDNIPVHIAESLEKLFGLKILTFFYLYTDPRYGIFLNLDPGEKIRIQDKHPGSATLVNSRIYKCLRQEYLSCNR